MSTFLIANAWWPSMFLVIAWRFYAPNRAILLVSAWAGAEFSRRLLGISAHPIMSAFFASEKNTPNIPAN